MTNKETADLFSQPSGDQRPQPDVEKAAAAFLAGTVDDWIEDQGAPHTFELASPRGKLYLTKSREEHKRLVAAGEVVFSPLELERFLLLQKKCKLARAARLERGEEEGPEAINDNLVDLIYQLKKMDPGAKLGEMKLDTPPAGEPWPNEEMADAKA